MTNFMEGDLVGVPCTVQPGPFHDEKLITVETVDGFISGFVKTENLKPEFDDENGLVTGVVIAASQATLEGRIAGSFFTTALGVASIPRDRVRAAA